MTMSILISKPPKQVANILNGKQSIIISKTAPKEWKDYLSGKIKEKPKPMTGYLYCTKDGYLHLENEGYWSYSRNQKYTYKRHGKVVAKFTLMEVEKITMRKICGEWEVYGEIHTDFIELSIKSCLEQDEIMDYMGSNMHAYAYHIPDLQIFDEPKEISEFRYWACLDKVKQAPRSWCYVEEL